MTLKMAIITAVSERELSRFPDYTSFFTTMDATCI